MSVLLMPLGNDAPFLDSDGNPLSGGLIYFYTAGSSALQDTFTTSSGGTANANPVVLGTGGYPTVSNAVVEIWGTSGVQYKAVLKTSAGVTVWTRDNLQLINDTSVSVSEWVSGPAPTYISAVSFSLVGDQTSTFQVGRRVKTTNSGGTVYSIITASAYGAVTTVTVVNDSGTLDAGLSAVSYGLLSATNPSIPVYSFPRRAATYAYTAWDPSDVAGTLTNASSTSSATSTATDCVTVANSSGTITWTCVKAGVYRFTIEMQNEQAAAMTGLVMKAALGGTATLLIGTATTITAWIGNATGFAPEQIAGAAVFYAVMTAGQTVTVLPKIGVYSAGVTTNFTTQCTVSAEYTGT